MKLKTVQNLKYIQILYWTEFNIETRFDTKYHLSPKLDNDIVHKIIIIIFVLPCPHSPYIGGGWAVRKYF